MANWSASNWTNGDEYACSGTPFVTGSHGTASLRATPMTRIVFPRVTRWIQVWNHNTTVAHTMKIAFTENGLSGATDPINDDGAARGHYIVLQGATEGMSTTGRLELRCTELWLAGDNSNKVNFTVLAGLTNIPTRNMFKMTGSIGGESQILGVG